MITEKTIKKIEKETNKILKKLYVNKTYVCIDHVNSDRVLEMTTITVRMGVYTDDCLDVQTQTNFKETLELDVYSIKQTAALIAARGLTELELCF